MGKVQQGILDGFVGKVGTVVGSFWKGKPTMRAYRRTVRNANTDEQAPVRLHFETLVHTASGFQHAFNIGLANAARAHRMTTGNYFVQRNWDVFTLVHGIFEPDWSKLVISQGNLFPENPGVVTSDDNCVIDVVLDRTLYGNQKITDKTWLVVYSHSTNTVYMDYNYRSDSSHIRIQAPRYEEDNNCSVYVFGEQDGMCSNSVYVGDASFKPYE